MATETITKKLYNDEVELTFYPASHRYKLSGSKDFLISVTAVTDIIDKSRQLMRWAVLLTVDYLMKFIEETPNFTVEMLKHEIVEAGREYDKKREKAADIGTQVHAWVEKFITSAIAGETAPDMPEDENVLNGIAGFLTWGNKHNIQFHCTERLVYSREHNYSGLLDAIATIDGKKYVIDFKTSKGIYSSFRYQVAGYRNAYEEENPADKIDGNMIIHFDKETGNFDKLDISNEEYELDKAVFLACLTTKRREKELSVYV